MSNCYKCGKNTQDLRRVNYQFRCGQCKDYDNGMHFATGTNPEDKSPFPGCGCLGICSECVRKKCQVCGNVKREETDNFASDCKICGNYNMDELIDKSDIDEKGNWIDGYGNIVGNCEQCVYCNNKTVCRKCAIAKADEKNKQQEIIRNQAQKIKELEERK